MRVKEKAIENIRNLMEQQELDWLAANGYEPVIRKPEPVRTTPVKKSSIGQLSANRFLGSLESETDSEPEIEIEQKAEIEPEEEAMPEPEEEAMPEPEEEATPEPEEETTPEPEPKIIEIIKQKEGTPHSWLYNEVVKAIRDAAGDGKNTKVIALIIPVIQKGKEFADLPVNDTVELSAVDEKAVKTPDLPENVASGITNATETETEIPIIDDVETGFDSIPDVSNPDGIEHVIDLLPEPMKEPDPELAEAFRDMEAKLDVDTAEDFAATPDVDVTEDIAAIPDVDATEDIAAIPDVDVTEDIAAIPDIDTTEDIVAIPNVDTTEELVTLPDIDTIEDIAAIPDVDVTEDIAAIPDVDMTIETDDYIAGQPLKFTELPPLDALDDEEIVDVSEQ